MELEGKSAFLTGAATGIGRAVAELFAREGANVYVADINEEAGKLAETEIRALGLSVTFVRVDVTDEASVRDGLAQVGSEAGRLDCAVNCAAVTVQGARNRTGDVDVQTFDEILSVDLRGLFLSVKYEILQMGETGGSIVNVSSGSGVVGTRWNPSYVAAKHGVVGLSKAAALDYADKGIRVNTLVPGVTETPILAGIPKSVRDEIETQIPMRRLARPLEIANGALWLCSDRSSYVTGSMLIIDGGFTAQ
ncbi:SDR family NAD(P)-dependent oxidoreductase [Parafrankia sp. EUN1f]|uniref:SDR family NAD(P)-dependent oxidoreductase n=1 Tax=Parafrankia sp. EUN1f TaxID=102897 RepID=UPI0001C473F0|nr:SDR family NAD(P)-dependent oxidoreductase [Parafrankia sp. EUN1f]EFC86775.1 short-chain dehydrogenase/reductase SDR [Parafrankia sp. EUN1f]